MTGGVVKSCNPVPAHKAFVVWQLSGHVHRFTSSRILHLSLNFIESIFIQVKPWFEHAQGEEDGALL